jgi:hypothetical protein
MGAAHSRSATHIGRAGAATRVLTLGQRVVAIGRRRGSAHHVANSLRIQSKQGVSMQDQSLHESSLGFAGAKANGGIAAGPLRVSRGCGLAIRGRGAAGR